MVPLTVGAAKIWQARFLSIGDKAMTDDTVTNWATRRAAALAWCRGHPVLVAAAAGFAAGWLLPKVLAWVL